MAVDIEKLMESFVPVKERSWYPWVWPDAEWWAKKRKDKPQEIAQFLRRIQEIAGNDLFFFADEILRNPQHIRLSHGVHAEMCHLLQQESDIGILVPRNHLKSTIASGAFPLWLMGRNPNIRIIIASAVLELSESLIEYMRDQILNNKRLHQVFPNLKPAEQKYGTRRLKNWSGSEFEIQRDMVFKEPTAKAMGMDNQCKTGSHCDLLLNDDVVTKDNADTDDKLRKVKENVQMSANLLDMGARTVFVGTRYHDNDCYGDMIEDGKIPFYVRKAIEDGEYIWPVPANVTRIEKMRDSMTAQMFSSQYMNDPVAEGDAEFEADWIKRWNTKLLRIHLVKNPPADDEKLIKEWFANLNIYMGCDPARSQNKRSDYTVILIVGVDQNGKAYCLDFSRKKLKTDGIVEEFIRMFDKWNPINAKVETYGGDIHVYNDIRKTMKERGKPWFRVGEYEKLYRTMSGEDRIRALQFPLSQGLVYIGSGPEWNELEYEFLRFPYGKHDDIITTLAYIWSQQLRKKREKVEKPAVTDHWQRRMTGRAQGGGDWLTQ